MKDLGRWYRTLAPLVVLAYVALVAAMFVLFFTVSMSHQDRGLWVAVAVCAAAIPLEQVANKFPKYRPLIIGLFILGFILSFFLVNLRLSVEWVIVILLGAALISGKFLTFARDWAVFIVVLVAWQVTDGLANVFHFPLHIRAMIDADKVIGFGTVPAVWLQQHFYDPHHVSWLDILSVIVYSFHFLLPLAAGFLLWWVNRRLYYRYAIAFSLAAIAGFATYILYPAVPPWMAVEHCPQTHGWACHFGSHHFLPWFQNRVTHAWSPGIHDVWNSTMAGWLSKNNGNVAFGPFHLGFDEVGAIPSEHVMYPTLVFLFLRRQFGRIGYWMLGYVALVLFVIAYMGQHYVVDGLVGIVYACIVYFLVMHAAPYVIGHLRRETGPMVWDEQSTSIPEPAADLTPAGKPEGVSG